MNNIVLDLSNPQVKAQLGAYVRQLQGSYRVTIVRERKRRSDLQNRYYWGVVVNLFAEWLRENGHEVDEENEKAHRMLAGRFLKFDELDLKTGEVIGDYIKSTSDLSTTEFIAYIEQCAQWMAEFCEVVVPAPDPFWKGQ